MLLNKLASAVSPTKFLEISERVFWRARLYCQLGINISTSKSLLPQEEKLIFENRDLICLAFMHLAFFISAICRDYFDRNVAKNIAMGSFFIICVSMRYLI